MAQTLQRCVGPTLPSNTGRAPTFSSSSQQKGCLSTTTSTPYRRINSKAGWVPGHGRAMTRFVRLSPARLKFIGIPTTVFQTTAPSGSVSSKAGISNTAARVHSFALIRPINLCAGMEVERTAVVPNARIKRIPSAFGRILIRKSKSGTARRHAIGMRGSPKRGSLRSANHHR